MHHIGESFAAHLDNRARIYVIHIARYDLAALFAYEFGRMSLHLPSIKAVRSFAQFLTIPEAAESPDQLLSTE